jgi:hypothetical protein
MPNNDVEASRPSHEIALVLMSIASFFLYGLGVLTLHQDRAPGWAVEAQGPIPVAVSYLMYGTPLGAVDDNVLQKFLQPNGASVQEILLMAATGSIPRGQVDLYTFDGTGVGSNLFTTIAMWMFGPEISSLTWLYLVFVGISVFAFVSRYHDKRIIVVPLYFLVVTVMLLTPLGLSHEAIEQMPIGGNRYFVLAAFLPALHIFFEIIEHSDIAEYKLLAQNLLILSIQGILLFAALLVRSSTSYLLGALLFVLLWRLYSARRKRDQFVFLFSKTAILCGAFAFWAVFVVTMFPAYVQTGRVFSVFWHRAFISFTFHPHWPFGDLQKVYNCTQYIPEGLDREHADRNGHCIWWMYPPNEQHANEVNQGLYGGKYEKALRDAYFYVLTHYPRQMFELYFSVKSRLIVNTLAGGLRYLFTLRQAAAVKGLFVIVTTQLILFIAFVGSIAVSYLTLVDRRLMIFPVFFVLSLMPLYVAWANQTTTSDTIFLMYSCFGLTLLLVIQLLAKATASGVHALIMKNAACGWTGYFKRPYVR